MSQGSPSPIASQITNWQNYVQTYTKNNGNRDGLKAFYADNAVALFTEGNSWFNKAGAIINGPDDIADDLIIHITAPNSPYPNLSLMEVGYGQQGNSGWSYGTWSTGTDPADPSGSFSVIWVKENGNWLIQVHSVVPFIPKS